MPPAPVATTAPPDAAPVSEQQDAGAQATSCSVGGGMRRVASAPAFKHASAYQPPSAAAAVAAAAADAAQAEQQQHSQAPSSSSSSSTGRAPWFGRRRRSSAAAAAQRSCSTCTGGRCRCLEVYVVSRAFTEFGGPVLKALPPDAREHMVDMGICHYMTVFKTPEGKLVQFDFGPTGGDVQKAHGPLATLLRRAHTAALQARTAEQQQDAAAAVQAVLHAAAAAAGPSGGSRGMVHSLSAPALAPLTCLDLTGEAAEGASAAVLQQRQPARRKKGVAAEIRERQLEALPPACMFMGRTQLSLADIRRYNSAQAMQYTLHEHDCRHYVNNLVQYATGVERSTQHLKRHYFHGRHADKWLWYGWFISATQFVTDVGNWYNVQAGAAATLLAVTGRSTLAQLKTLATPMLPALKSLPSMMPAAAAAGGAGGGGGAVVAGLATSLKLPASLLLKRPLAGSAVAAAGGAGAAAAAIRTGPGAAVDGAAAAGGGSGSGAGGARGGSLFGGFGWGRPLRQWRDGLGQGFRGAVMTLRRAAVGNRDAAAATGLRPAFAAVPGSAGAAVAGSQQRSWLGFGARRPAQQRQLSYAGVGAGAVASSSAAVMVLPGAAVAAGGAGAAIGARSSRDGAAAGAGGSNRRPVGGFVGLGHHVGRHVLWLGSTAAKATGSIAAMAGRQVSSLVTGRPSTSPGMAAAAAAMGGSPAGLTHSASSGSILRQQAPAPQRGLASQRSQSAPSLAVVAAAGTAVGGRSCPGGAAPEAGVSLDGVNMLLDCGGGDVGRRYDDVWGCGGGSSSLTCSSVGGRPSGVGRQVLNLPAPRLSWGRRASNVVIRQ